MTNSNIARQRLHNQLLTQHPFTTPCEVVSWMSAVQAQEYPAAKWAVGLRLPLATDNDIEQAVNDGSILRTHVLRPTWHFVSPADIRWMLALTAPHVHAATAYWYRQLELDDTIFQRSDTIIGKELMGGKQLTREELGLHLNDAGIDTSNLRLTHLMFHAELEGIISSGPRKGKQFTYALLDERVPIARPLTRDEALDALTLRYFTSHGPATIKDYVWWSGLPMTEAKAGIEGVKSQLRHERIKDQDYWFVPSSTGNISQQSSVQLLPAYDEYIVGYTDRSAVFDKSTSTNMDSRDNILFTYIIVLNGQIVGTWKRTIKKDKILVSQNVFVTLTSEEEKAVNAEIEKYAAFFGLSLT